MIDSLDQLAFIGFGEAGAAFAAPMVSGGQGTPSAYDRKGVAAKACDFAAAGVRGAATNGDAVARATLVLSLVTADRAVSAARETVAGITPDTLYCDGNSVSPETKRQAAAVIEAAGAHYVDVAVLAPVFPLQLGASLLPAGPRAAEAREALTAIGFTNVSVAGDKVGQAAAIKMIRSVMIKGIEALSAELAAAADAAGVRDAVVASLDASWPRELGWGARIEGSLERMAKHGLRRAAEMDEAAATLVSLGVDNSMALATAGKQRAGGSARREQAA